MLLLHLPLLVPICEMMVMMMVMVMVILIMVIVVMVMVKMMMPSDAASLLATIRTYTDVPMQCYLHNL
jgi:hypothetical protein